MCDVLDANVQCKREQWQRVHFSICYNTVQWGEKNAASTYLFWCLDSTKSCHDVVYRDLIFIVCVSLERPGGQFWLKGESCTMFNIVPTKSNFLKISVWVGTAAWHPPPAPPLGAALHETLL